MADLGADVVKIEPVKGGEDGRRITPMWNGHSASFIAINRNKRSVCINLKTPKGLEIAKKLVDKADVVIENFRRGVMANLKLDPETVMRRNPRLIYCSMSAYGEEGPDALKAGYDAVVQAKSGIMSVNGANAGQLARVGISPLDAGSGIWAALAVTVALYERKKTGRGQVVGTSLLETGVYWMNYHITSYQATHIPPAPEGTRIAAFAPYRAYNTKDGQVVVGVSNDGLFRRITAAVGKPELASDTRFLHNAERVRNRDQLDEELEGVLKLNTSDHWIKTLEEVGVPCSKIQNVAQVMSDAQVKTLRLLKETPYPGIPNLFLQTIPVRLANHSLAVRFPAPLLGEHTKEVLEDLGLSKEEIEELVKGEIIGSEAESEANC